MDPSPVRSRVPMIAMGISLLLIPVNVVVWFMSIAAQRDERDAWMGWFTAVALAQLIAGLVALAAGALQRARTKKFGLVPAIFGALSTLGAVAGWVAGGAGWILMSGAGGAWGRPLRIKGKQLHPELRRGSDWTLGPRPDPRGLGEAERAALEALWLHDAQKEHASVPAFSRISWMLAAVGAPAELLEWAHRAAMEEIAHTRLCFALAAGYSGRSFSVQPMPELLMGGLDVRGNALEVLAAESLGDGCQLEDFNADVAAQCAEVCEEPATKAALGQIAREERTHADFSWAVLRWLLERDRAAVEPVIRASLAKLEAYRRPTAVSAEKRSLVSRADATVLLRHGRLPDARWAELWDSRLEATRRQVGELLAVRKAA